MKNQILNFQPRSLSTPCKASRLGVRSIAAMAALWLVSATFVMAQAPGFLPSPVRTVSTLSPTGDVNPYGVAFVPSGFPGGVLNPGDILVSNFNNAENLQGTGTSIIRVPTQGAPSLFFTSTRPEVGLSTALAAVKEGLVIVGSFPTAAPHLCDRAEWVAAGDQQPWTAGSKHRRSGVHQWAMGHGSPGLRQRLASHLHR